MAGADVAAASAAPAPAADRAIPRLPGTTPALDRRTVLLGALAVLVALAAACIAQLLTRLIAFFTNLAFFQRVSFEAASPADNHLGLWVIGVPAVGGLVVGVMAKYGSRAIRGHGIPEAMERVLFHQSRIQPRITFLKPLSAAIAIGTGGPFGAEGPIIATGGALGSLLGQVITVTADERKTLLAAGAAAGMAATFGAPVSAVLLAIELLLFEYRARSIVPVALATSTATAVRIALVGGEPVFKMADVASPGGEALATYIGIGAVVGIVSVFVTRAVYWLEDAFEKLPFDWMWWPALGGLAVGAVGWFAPKTLGVGYDNIDQIVMGTFAGRTLMIFCVLKFLSWCVSLASGTSGGTLAPLFTIGGGLGSVLGSVAAAAAPSIGIDPRVGALVGMAAMFAGASRALLASVVFAFECTRQPLGLLPLLGGCTSAYLASCLLMRNSIMTERIVRRGARVVGDYAADFLGQVLVKDCMTRNVVTLRATDDVSDVRASLAARGATVTHGGFPVVDAGGRLVGVVTRGDMLDVKDPDARVQDCIRRTPAAVFEDCSAREAADHMLAERVGRLPVVDRAEPTRLVGILTRSDLLEAHERRLHEAHAAQQPTTILPLVRRFRSRAAVE